MLWNIAAPFFQNSAESASADQGSPIGRMQVQMKRNNGTYGEGRLSVLDGWRGISILCVLAGHMLPLGPKVLHFNGMIVTTGMSLFFALSGFLIVSLLLRHPNVVSFLVRRVFRILPLAYAYLFIVLLWNGANWDTWRANLLFYANIPPFYLNYANAHLWSLSVEMQTYAALAAVVAMGGRRGLALTPVACLTVTMARIVAGEQISIVTWHRVDEILAGGTLALVLNQYPSGAAGTRAAAFAPVLLALLLLASCHPDLGPMNYGRPYFASLLIGSTIIRSEGRLFSLLSGRPLGYLARISYALYIIHPLTESGWMSQGDALARGAKRVLSICLSFLFAHSSTKYYERYWNELGHRLAARIEHRFWFRALPHSSPSPASCSGAPQKS